MRALAIRTMGCLRAEKIIDYLPDPLDRALADESPYVRKTAVVCVAKLFSLKPDLAVEGGFVDRVKEMVSDNNAMVVANAVTALNDIQETAQELPGSSDSMWLLDSDVLMKLLVALNECTEWGRIAILNTIAAYRSRDAREAEHICERVVPQFQHANGSVVLAAVKVVLLHMDATQQPALIQQHIRKMAPPLVTLVTSEPEVQWVALRNINLILQQYPDILANELRVFFCKYNDPPYVKAEKIRVMVKLASEKNMDTLLGELKEYTTEVDVDFVRHAIRAIGQCAIAIEPAAERCVQALLELIESRATHIVQEATVVVRDIFRKYPHRYTRILPQLCASMDEIDEPEAKAALVWIIGEYADKIDNAAEQLEAFLEQFVDDEPEVQFQTLTAIVKLFLKKPDSAIAQRIVQTVLERATQACDNMDLRDRAFIYWRLLSSAEAQAAHRVVLAAAPPITIPRAAVSPALLHELLKELSMLSSVYHKPASAFIGEGRSGLAAVHALYVATSSFSHSRHDDSVRAKALATVAQGEKSEALLDLDFAAPAPDAPAATRLDDLLSDEAPAAAPAPAAGGALDDLLGMYVSPLTQLRYPGRACGGAPRQVAPGRLARSPIDYDCLVCSHLKNAGTSALICDGIASSCTQRGIQPCASLCVAMSQWTHGSARRACSSSSRTPSTLA